MLFSSPIFLYIFLPIILLCYYISPKFIKNYILLIGSLLFYAWGGVSLLALLLISIFINFVFGILIDKSKTKKLKKIAITAGVVINIGLIMYFKYANFIVFNLNEFLSLINSHQLTLPNVILPIGISFFTFQAASYLIDVYRGTTKAQYDFFKLALFISFFPQLIAGPIVRYQDIADQLDYRESNVGKFSSGIRRFILGLARKVLIANPMALIADQVFSTSNADLTISMAWLGIIAYSFQIYYDFAGYSDMAIGLARMFGFELLENFNSPYIARSIKDFWRRWHISLSTWFRDYLYIPLGGNRIGKSRTYVNLLVVFFLTGLWHGAAWNFVVWGFIHGFFLIIERAGFEKILLKIPKIFQHIYTLFVVLIAWVFFRANNGIEAINYIKTMFGFGNPYFAFHQVFEFLTTDFYIILLVAFLGSIEFFKAILEKYTHYITSCKNSIAIALLNIYQIFALIFIIGMLLLCTLYLTTNSYNPFIYFRF